MSATPARRPESSIFYGHILEMVEYPGVRFVVPRYPADDWECPAVLVDDAVLDQDYVLAAVVAFGRIHRLTAGMRRAHKRWVRDDLPSHKRDAELECSYGAEE